MENHPIQPFAADAELRGDIDARVRLMACMQDLIRGLGQANSDLAHELGVRRRINRELVNEFQHESGSDDSVGGENESLIITCGQNAILSLPESGECIPLPCRKRNGSALPVSKKNGLGGRSILVSRWKPVPRLVKLSHMLADLPVTRQARLVELVVEVVCLELAQSILRDDEARPLVRTNLIGILITDSSGIIRMVNQKLCKMTGRQSGDLIGNSMRESLLSDEDQRFMDVLGADGTADLQIIDVWYGGGQHPPFPVKMLSRSIACGAFGAGCVSVVMELTDQQQQIEELANKEKMYRRFFEEDVTGDYSCTADGRIIACNPAFARIFGFASVEEAADCNLRQLHVSGESADHFLDTLKRHRRLNYYESVMRRADGKHIHVIRNVNGTFNNQGALTEITGYIFDNTEQKLLEEKVRESQKMESVGRLAGGVAHDFNNLLLTIQGYASLLEDRIPLDSEGREALEQIQKASDRAAMLTRQLLAFSRRQVLQPATIDLNETIKGMSSLLQRMLGDDIELVAQLDGDLGNVRADRAQLEQVLVNLVSNARDAMPEGGRLTLSTRNANLRDTWFSFHDGPPPGDYVELSVQDNGVGMSKDVKSHLFEPFFTTKDQGMGTGLGLPTVYGIIKQSGGEIQVYSEYGKGSTFKVCLPLMEVAIPKATPVETRPSTNGKTTILLVEDEESVRSLVSKILVKKGYNIVEACDGKEALELMESQTEEIPLLLTDLIMPKMNGRQLYEHLHHLYPNMEVIYMSGYTEDEVVKKGVMHEKVNFLQKPFNPKGLVEKVTQVLESARP